MIATAIPMAESFAIVQDKISYGYKMREFLELKVIGCCPPVIGCCCAAACTRTSSGATENTTF